MSRGVRSMTGMFFAAMRSQQRAASDALENAAVGRVSHPLVRLSDEDVGGTPFAQLLFWADKQDFASLVGARPELAQDGGHQARGLDVAKVPSPIWDCDSSLETPGGRIELQLERHHQKRRLQIARRNENPRPDPTTHLYVQVPGQELRLPCKRAADLREGIGLRNFHASQTGGESVEVGLQMKKDSIEDLHSLVKGVAKKVAPVQRIQSSCGQGLDTTLQIAERFYQAACASR